MIVGERDLFDIRSIADSLVAELPNVERHVIAGVGHAPNLEDPASFNRLTKQFLARLHDR